MPDFFKANGFLWPPHESPKQNASMYEKKYMRAAADMTCAFQQVAKPRVAIQAGGHCGMWARWLAARFGAVYTWEPHEDNFKCLTYNAALPNIFAARGMLGEVAGPLQLERSAKYTGAHHGKHEHGAIPVYRIDDLRLRHLDMLVLDVEGMELPALRGAKETIERHRPIIHMEDRGHGERYGWGSFAEITSWLDQFGYRECGRVHHDVVFRQIRL